MAFDINELRASISRYGMQKASHYTTIVTLPSTMGGSNIMSETPLRINSVNLPGINLGLDEIRHKGFGLGEKRPISVSYDDISITMIADGQGQLAATMHEWMELIYPSDLESVGADNVEYFEYPNNYYGGLEIDVFDMMGNPHTNYSFIQPFPTAVGAVQMSWETTDQLLLLPVTFSYRSFRKNSDHSGYISQ